MMFVSLVNAPANRNSSGVRTQNSLCGHGMEYSAGLGAIVHKRNSLPASEGSPLRDCCTMASLHDTQMDRHVYPFVSVTIKLNIYFIDVLNDAHYVSSSMV